MLGFEFSPVFRSTMKGIHIAFLRVHCPDETQIRDCEEALFAVRDKFLNQTSWTWKIWTILEEDAVDMRADREVIDPPRWLGDYVESIMKWTGIQWVVYQVAYKLDRPCGCDARRRKLNDLHIRTSHWVRRQIRYVLDCCKL